MSAHNLNPTKNSKRPPLMNADLKDNIKEFPSPTKSIQNIFRNKDSLDLSDGKSVSSGDSGQRKRLSLGGDLTQSPTRRSLVDKLKPMFGRSRSASVDSVSNRNSITISSPTPNHPRQEYQFVKHYHPSVDDFADTDDSNENEDYDISSVESILKEYRIHSQPKAPKFNEHFDDQPKKTSNQRLSVIERTLHETSSSNASAYFDAQSQTRDKGSNTNSDKSTQSNDTIKSGSRFTIYSDDDKREKMHSGISNESGFNPITILNMTHDSEVADDEKSGMNNTFNDTSEKPLNIVRNQYSSNKPDGGKNPGARNSGVRNSGDKYPIPSQRASTLANDDSFMDVSESALNQSSRMSWSSNELLTRLEDRSMSDLSEKTETESIHSRTGEKVQVFRPGSPVSPRLIHVANTGSPPPMALDAVHYHDSDISRHTSIRSGEIEPPNHSPETLVEPWSNIPPGPPVAGSTQPQPQTQTQTQAQPQLQHQIPPSRRPPPSIPTKDNLAKYNVHEGMHHTNDNGDIGSTISSPRFSDEEDFYDAYDDEKSLIPRKKYQHYSYWYFATMMILGLILPPIYFLIPTGTFDRLLIPGTSTNSKIHYNPQVRSRRNNIIRFSTVQKLISMLIGLFWIAVVLAMIGVGIGLSQT